MIELMLIAGVRPGLGSTLAGRFYAQPPPWEYTLALGVLPAPRLAGWRPPHRGVLPTGIPQSLLTAVFPSHKGGRYVFSWCLPRGWLTPSS